MPASGSVPIRSPPPLQDASTARSPIKDASNLYGIVQVLLGSAIAILVAWVGWSVHQIEVAAELRSENVIKIVDSLDRRISALEQSGAPIVRERLAVLEALVKQNGAILQELRATHRLPQRQPQP